MKYLFFLLFIGLSQSSFAQATTQNQVLTKPTVMVYPFVKEGQDMRTILESDFNLKVVVSKVREAFDNRGYSTVDFIARVRALGTGQMLDDGQTDVKTAIVQASDADVVVEVEYEVVQGSGGTKVRVLLKSFESSTFTLMSSKSGDSRLVRTEDIGALAGQAIDSVVEDFLNVMQEKFTDIVNNGRFMAVEFGLEENSEITLDTEVGEDGLPLKDLLEIWIGENSNSYHLLGVTDKKIIFDQVRIPRLDATGKNLTTSKYSLDIYKFCNKLTPTDDASKKLKIARVIKGNTILISFK